MLDVLFDIIIPLVKLNIVEKRQGVPKEDKELKDKGLPFLSCVQIVSEAQFAFEFHHSELSQVSESHTYE